MVGGSVVLVVVTSAVVVTGSEVVVASSGMAQEAKAIPSRAMASLKLFDLID